jgi:hypothetical protein
MNNERWVGWEFSWLGDWRQNAVSLELSKWSTSAKYYSCHNYLQAIFEILPLAFANFNISRVISISLTKPQPDFG